MLKVVTTEEMRRIEKEADAGGLSYDAMMANAGASIAEVVFRHIPDIETANVLVLVGPGNNGGDGLVVGYHLMKAGAKVEIYMSHPRSTEDDHNYARLEEAGIPITLAKNDDNWRVLRNAIKNSDLIVDALLGTGIKLPLRGAPQEILSKTTNLLEKLAYKPFILAVDCPSGLDCDTGQIADESLMADITVTLAAAKPGLFEFPGAAAAGEVVVGPIGVTQDQPEMNAVRHILAQPEGLCDWLPERPLNSHKGTFGKVLIIAGSVNFPGAAALSALGAYRSGAGLVTLAVPSSIQSLIAPILPESTWVLLPHEMGVIASSAASVVRDELSGVDALLLGPGFSREPTTKEFIENLLLKHDSESSRKLGFVTSESTSQDIKLPGCVVDADGLKLLSELPNWNELFERTAILTPHPGEFAIMTGLSIEDILGDRIKYGQEFAEKWGHVVVLKGAFTHIAAPDGRIATIPIATPALATAGTGDVLAGIIVAMRAQGMDAFKAAVLGAYVHARAGECAADDFGTDVSVIAGDIVDFLPAVFTELYGR